MLNPAVEMGILPLLQLLRLASPALPIGAYSYSQGLEWAVEAGWVRGEEAAAQWIKGLLRFPWTYLEVPVLLRLFTAWQSGSQKEVKRWSLFLRASRESGELQAAEAQMGQALARLLGDLGIKEAQPWVRRPEATLSTLFALAAVRFGIPAQSAVAGFLWSLAESQVAAAIKLVPLGQTAGQRLLTQIMEAIPSALSVGLELEDQDLGYLAPGLALASALHETQRTRLFRS